MSSMDAGRHLITYSRLAAFRSCPRKHYYQYMAAIRPEEVSDALRIGSMGHVALEMRANGVKLGAVKDWIRSSYQSSVPSWVKDDQDWIAEAEMLCALIHGYFWRYQNEQFEYVAPEQVFNLPLDDSNGYQLAGKVDSIIKVGDRHAIMEHKFIGEDISENSNYWLKLQHDHQVTTYCYAAQRMGYHVTSCLYDVIKKPTSSRYKATPEEKRKYKKDGSLYANQRERDETGFEYGQRIFADIRENPDKYYARKEIPRVSGDIEQFQQEVEQMVMLIDDGRINYRNTDACLRPYKCPYFKICVSGTYPIAEVPEGFVQLDFVHPELEGDAPDEDSDGQKSES